MLNGKLRPAWLRRAGPRTVEDIWCQKISGCREAMRPTEHWNAAHYRNTGEAFCQRCVTLTPHLKSKCVTGLLNQALNFDTNFAGT